jgi:hypothetical protein
MKEELIEFKMPQSSTRSMSSTPTPEAPAKPKDHSDNHNCGKDVDYSKAAPVATDSTKVTDKPSRRDSDKNSIDNGDEKTDLDMPTTAQPDVQGESAEYRSVHQRVRQSC